MAVSFWATALVVPILGLVALIGEGAPGALQLPSVGELAALAYLGLVVTAGAFCLWYASILSLGVDRAGLFTGLVPVSALFAAAAAGQSDPGVVIGSPGAGDGSRRVGGRTGA